MRTGRLLNWWHDYRWFLWAGAMGLVFILGYVGFRDHYGGQDARSTADLVYLSLQLFPLQSGALPGDVPWELEIARITAPALAAVGIIGALTALYRAFRQEPWRLARARDHVVICGCGRRGSLLAVALAKGDQLQSDVVVIENGASPAHVESCRREGVLILSGDATDSAVLERAGIQRARHLVALCGEDVVNARIAVSARTVLRDRPNPDLEAHVHVADEELVELLDTHPERLLGSEPGLRSLRTFDVFATAAQAMLNLQPRFDPAAWRADDRLMVVGLGELGQHLVVEAADRIHDAAQPFPLPILVLDRDAEAKVSHLETVREDLARRWLPKCWKGDLAGAEFDRGAYLKKTDTDATSVRAIYVCFDNEHLALTTTLRLMEQFEGVPIKVRMTQRNAGLATLLPTDKDVVPFGLMEEACTPALIGLDDPET